MDLDQQVQDLIQNAPQDGTTPQLVAEVGPILQQVAGQLKHLQYYIVQTLEQDWAITTLGHPSQSDREKQVIYAFSALKDIASSPYPVKDPGLIALPIPVLDLLFRILTIDAIDSVIFFDTPGNPFAGIEIERAYLLERIQAHFSDSLRPSSPSIPPDLA